MRLSVTRTYSEDIASFFRCYGTLEKYEFLYVKTDHLGNVQVIISDKKIGVDRNGDGKTDYYMADVRGVQDYYPYGMIMTGRKFNAGSYRFGFGSYEKDDELKGVGKSYDMGERLYDPRIGRPPSPDPLWFLFPGWSPYRAFFDNPIYWTDKDGLIEWPLKGTKAINKHEAVYKENQSVWSKRAQSWVKQTGYFEGGRTNEYSAFEKNPDANTLIRTSQYNIFRMSTPRAIMTSPHIGMDYKAKLGTDVYSLGTGTIESIDAKGGVLTVKYGDDLITFRHLSNIDASLEKGTKVYEGQIIGQSGKTATKLPHLHIEARDKEGKSIDTENKNYGTITNEEFFNKYRGDYKQLPGYKQDNPEQKTDED